MLNILIGFDLLMWCAGESLNVFTHHLFDKIRRWDGEVEALVTSATLDAVLSLLESEGIATERQMQLMQQWRQIMKFPLDYPERFIPRKINLTRQEMTLIDLYQARQLGIPIVCFNDEQYRKLSDEKGIDVAIWSVLELDRQLEVLHPLSVSPAPDILLLPEVLLNSQGNGNDPDKVANYYIELAGEDLSELEHKSKPLNEAKILLVGQGSVGKTSLAKRLIEGTFNPNEPKTEGLSVKKWTLPIKGQEIQLNIWDFGGQEIMHTTHQFFLTKRSLYLLVLDARLEQEENRVEYWLKIIQGFGGNSPVIVVGNKCDQQPLDIDRQGLQNKYPNIKAFVETSCQNGTKIEDLKQVIIEEISQLDHIHSLLPLSWFEVKTLLEKLDRDYMPYSEYERLCTESSVTEELSQRTLIGFLHDLGVVLNFQEDDRLHDTNVLNPKWVTEGVYRILNDRNSILEHKGILKRQHLDDILDPKRYPRQKRLFIMDVMRKFELCFDIEPDQQFLIPDLLPKEEPYTGDWQDTLAFEYHYPVLPNSIISRFIVRMSDKIHQHTYWRSGVLLAYEGNKALVKADREDRKIVIRVGGNQNARRSFLTAIRTQFASIHRTIPGLEVEQKVRIAGHSKVDPIDYQYLLDLEELGEDSFIPPGLKIRVNVKQLLNGIEPEQDRQDRRERRQIVEQQDRNIYITNLNVQENQPVSNPNQTNINQHGLGDNIAGDKVMGDKIHTQNNYSQNLAQAAEDIKALLNRLSQDYPNNTPMVGAKAIEAIDHDPKLKGRVVNALKEAGSTALEKLVDHPAISIVVAGAKGFMNT